MLLFMTQPESNLGQKKFCQAKNSVHVIKQLINLKWYSKMFFLCKGYRSLPFYS